MEVDGSVEQLGVVPAVTDAREETFDGLYGRHVDRALRLAGLLCGDRPLAEDVVADAFLKVLPKWRAHQIDDFWPYLRVAVVNELRRTYRRNDTARRWRHRTHTRGDAAGPAEEIADRARVAAALEALTGRQRMAVVLRYFEDLTERETAELMACSIGTVKSTTAKGLARLRELLTEEDS